MASALKWYHYIGISLGIHAVVLSVCNAMIADIPTMEVPRPKGAFVYMPPLISIADEGDTTQKAVAIDADVNPFAPEKDDPVEVRPNLQLEMPRTQAEPDFPAPDAPQPVVDTATIQEAPDPSPTESLQPVDLETKHSNAVQELDQMQTTGGENGNSMTQPGTGQTPAPHAASDAIQANALQPPKTDETALWNAYKKQLNAHFKAHRHYPEMARRLKLTGTAMVAIELDRSGNLISVALEQSSGIDILDDAAIASAKSASPAPPFPEGTTAMTQKVLIPYKYQLN